MELPIEMVCNILKYVDGATLIRSQRVCMLWRDAVLDYELNKEEHWEVLCRREILPEFLADVIDKLFPSYFSNMKNTVSWKLVYKCWYRWRGMKSWPVEIIQLNINTVRKISCVKFSGSWLICGVADRGTLMAYELHTGEVRLLYNGWGVKDFILTGVESDSKTTRKNDCTELLHSELFVYTYNSFSFHLDLRSLKATVVNCLTNDSSWFRLVNSYMYKNIKAVSSLFEDVGCLTEPTATDMWNWLHLHYNVALGRTLRTSQKVVFRVGAKHKVLRTFKHFGYISTALLHADNFLVATENGFIYRYGISKHDDLLKLHFKDYDWHIQVHLACQDFIQSLDVCEMYTRPYILVAMETRISLINFSEDSKNSISELYRTVNGVVKELI